MRNRLYRADKAGSRGKEKSPCRNCPEAVYSKGFGVPEVIRTPDLPLRRRSLYPAELRKQNPAISVIRRERVRQKPDASLYGGPSGT